MAGILKIKDLRSSITAQGKTFGCLAFDINDLLPLVTDEGSLLAWSVFPIGEGTFITGDLSPLGMDAGAFSRQVDASADGVQMSWEQLRRLADCIHQTIWGTYIGCEDAGTFTELAALFEDQTLLLFGVKPAFCEAVSVAFQAVDSSFWLVYAKDDGVLQRIRNAFQHVEMLKVW